ncbi:MAG: phosphoribosyltransferase family protein, partial [Chloroflexota bacterium]
MENPQSRVQILDQAAIQARLRRMAYEIYETHYGSKRLIVIGIDVRGGVLAHELVRQLREISSLEVEL